MKPAPPKPPLKRQQSAPTPTKSQTHAPKPQQQNLPMGVTSAPVPAAPQASASALVVPQDMAAACTEDAAENMEHVHDAFHRISIQGARYRVGIQPIGNQGVQFDAVILKEVPVNIFYKSKYDPSNPVNPDCWSLGGMKPDPAVTEKQNDSCVTCKWNKFGTGTDQEGKRSRGKACRNSRRLILHIDGVDMPTLLGLPPTTIKMFNQYLKMLSSNTPPVPMFAVVTRFTFDPQAQYPKPVLSAVRVVTPPEFAELREYRNSQVVIDALNAYASPEEYVEETEEQAQAGMEAGEQHTADGKKVF